MKKLQDLVKVSYEAMGKYTVQGYVRSSDLVSLEEAYDMGMVDSDTGEAAEGFMEVCTDESRYITSRAAVYTEVFESALISSGYGMKTPLGDITGTSAPSFIFEDIALEISCW